MALFRRRRKAPTLQQPELPGMPSAGTAEAGKGSGEHAKFPLMTLRESSVSRRSFLMRSLAWVTAAIGASLAALGLGAIVAPAMRKDEDQWSPIGRPGDPGPGEPDLAQENVPILTSFTSLVKDAYMAAAPQNIPVMVINHGGGKFTVFDVRCTHLGCPISIGDKAEVFNCPCHGGEFDEEGKVLAGPPPRPLDRYAYKVEDGVLYAGQLFQVNDQLQRVT